MSRSIYARHVTTATRSFHKALALIAQDMDDPWANAWREPKSNLPDAALSSDWSAPSVSVLHGDHEDDLSTPSWSIKPTTQWNEPDVSGASLWNHDPSTSAWNPPPSTFDRISLHADSVQLESPFQIATSPGFREFNAQSPTPPPTSVSPPAATPPRIKLPDSPSPVLPHNSTIVPSISIPAAEDIDGFGTFETAPDTAEAVGWSPSKPPLSLPSADATAWGSTWQDPFSGTADESDEADDAWEVAREQKAKQDQHVVSISFLLKNLFNTRPCSPQNYLRQSSTNLRD